VVIVVVAHLLMVYTLICHLNNLITTVFVEFVYLFLTYFESQ